jgi:hypothetical protein
MIDCPPHSASIISTIRSPSQWQLLLGPGAGGQPCGDGTHEEQCRQDPQDEEAGRDVRAEFDAVAQRREEDGGGGDEALAEIERFITEFVAMMDRYIEEDSEKA